MSKVTLGQTGVYTDSEGKPKAALVIATRKSTLKGMPVDRPEKGTVNVLVFAPNGQSYTRENVRIEDDGEGRTFRAL